MKAKPTQISNNNFRTKFINKKSQVNEILGKKAINTVKSQQKTTYRQQGKQIILTDREINQQTLRTSSQQTRKI